MSLRTRIAPTPSGFLHAGNAWSFLLTAEYARKENGTLLLRIDDLDAARKRPEYADDIFETLNWLGIPWQEGPRTTAEFEQSWSQQLRLPAYQALIAQLIQKGAPIFACSCSRTDLAGHTVYPGTCLNKNIPLDTPDTSLRIHVSPGQTVTFYDYEANLQSFPLGKEAGSFVIRRRDGIPAYQIASLSDDVQFRINTIVRGMDLLASTACQIYLAEKLGLTEFQNIRFIHHPLLRDETGEKLSKSQGSSALREIRKQGISAFEFFRNYPAFNRFFQD